MKKIGFLIALLVIVFSVSAQDTIYQIIINDKINSKSWVYMQRGFQEAENGDAHLILLHLNTYGGELMYADSIRTLILNSPIPVVAFIDNNAASAGALISIACQRIYMRKGANIGAATVVSGSDGTQMPDKYQSYMRSMMRSTAESHGKDSLGKWIRDPLIAEAMVDNRTVIPNLIDSGKTLTFTTTEAIQWGYCEGEAEKVTDVLFLEGYEAGNYTLQTYHPSFWHTLLGILSNSVLQSIFIMLILGGIYFELQSPGIGFPLIVAITAAVLFFAPLYIEGLAEYWEIILFVIGIILLLLEIFVIPGFGIAGISGILLIIIGLVFSLLNNINFNFEFVTLTALSKALFTVTISLLLSVGIIFYLSSRIGKRGIFRRLALNANQLTNEGYIGVDTSLEQFIGQEAVVSSDLRPVGKVRINNQLYDAIAEYGYIKKGSNVTIIGFSTNQLKVRLNA